MPIIKGTGRINPLDLDRNFTKKCLRKFSFIANSNKEIDEDLRQSFYNVAQVGLENESPY